MVDILVSKTGIEKTVLINEYKVIHQQYCNVEYPFSTLQLPSIKKKYADYSDVELKKILNEAFHRFKSSHTETSRKNQVSSAYHGRRGGKRWEFLIFF